MTALHQLARLLPPWLTADAATRAFGWGICASYVMAFGSFYPQIGGMLGPVRERVALPCDCLATCLKQSEQSDKAPPARSCHRTASFLSYRACHRRRFHCRYDGCAAPISALTSSASAPSFSRWLEW